MVSKIIEELSKILTQDYEMSTNPFPQNTFCVFFQNFLNM